MLSDGFTIWAPWGGVASSRCRNLGLDAPSRDLLPAFPYFFFPSTRISFPKHVLNTYHIPGTVLVTTGDPKWWENRVWEGTGERWGWNFGLCPSRNEDPPPTSATPVPPACTRSYTCLPPPRALSFRLPHPGSHHGHHLDASSSCFSPFHHLIPLFSEAVSMCLGMPRTYSKDSNYPFGVTHHLYGNELTMCL